MDLKDATLSRRSDWNEKEEVEVHGDENAQCSRQNAVQQNEEHAASGDQEEQNGAAEEIKQQPRHQKDHETSENQKRENKETTDIYRQHQHETTENQEHLDEAVVKVEHAQDQVMIAGITELAEELSNLIISTAGSELCSISEPIGESPSFPANFDEYSSYSDLLGADDPSDVPPAISDSSSPNFIVEKKHGEDIPSLPADDEELISSYRPPMIHLMIFQHSRSLHQSSEAR